MLNKSLFLAVASLFFALALPAQTTYKYGHMNFGNLLSELVETKKAEIELQAFGNKFAVKDDSLTKAFQVDYDKFVKDYEGGLLTPVVAQQTQAELEKRQIAIQAFEEDAQKQVTDKREELLKPIIERVQAAIETVAKANGYSMILDTSTGAALYALETEDVTPLVKKQLGI